VWTVIYGAIVKVKKWRSYHNSRCL